MVAAGIGITVMPMSAVKAHDRNSELLSYIPFDKPVPDRRVVLAWRKSFPRITSIEALKESVYACGLEGVTMLNSTVT